MCILDVELLCLVTSRSELVDCSSVEEDVPMCNRLWLAIFMGDAVGT